MELENQRTKLNDTCRTAHYSQEGIDQLLFRIESAKKLLLGIEGRYSEYKKSPKLINPIKKLNYAIKTTLKKVQDIREHMSANRNQEGYREETSGPETQDAAETKRKRKFSEITPSERQLQFIDPRFSELESHAVGTPVTATTFSKTPRMEGIEQIGSGSNETGENDYSYLFTRVRFGGSGYGGGGDDNSGGNGNRKGSNKKDPDHPSKQGPSAG